MDKDMKQKAYMMELQLQIGSKIPALIRKYEGKEVMPVKELQQVLLDATMFMSSDECMFKHIEEMHAEVTKNIMLRTNEN
jgi:hypothetical protein